MAPGCARPFSHPQNEHGDLMFCVRFRQASHTGRDAEGPYARTPTNDPPLFLARGFRQDPVRLGDMPDDLWACPTRAGAGMVARSHDVKARALRDRYVVDVVSLRYALTWVMAALAMDDHVITPKEQAAIDRLRALDAQRRAKKTTRGRRRA